MIGQLLVPMLPKRYANGGGLGGQAVVIDAGPVKCPGSVDLIRVGPGTVTFIRTGPGTTTITRVGPGSVDITRKGC